MFTNLANELWHHILPQLDFSELFRHAIAVSSVPVIPHFVLDHFRGTLIYKPLLISIIHVISPWFSMYPMTIIVYFHDFPFISPEFSTSEVLWPSLVHLGLLPCGPVGGWAGPTVPRQPDGHLDQQDESPWRNTAEKWWFSNAKKKHEKWIEMMVLPWVFLWKMGKMMVLLWKIQREHVDRFRSYSLGRLNINDHLYCQYCLQLSLEWVWQMIKEWWLWPFKWTIAWWMQEIMELGDCSESGAP